MEQIRKAIKIIEEKWRSLHLLVVGDVMLDQYIWGEVSRISPEAPVPVVRASRRSDRPGGAANVALNIARLGAKATVIGFAGTDHEERILTKSLHASGVEAKFIPLHNCPTTSKLRILSSNQQMLRLDREPAVEPGEEDYQRLIATALPLLSCCNALLLSDYAKGTLHEKVCSELIAAARNHRIPVLVDPKRADFSRYHGATTICPNLKELAEASTFSLRNGASSIEKALLQAAEPLLRACDVEFLTVTMGERGIAFLRPGECFISPAVARQVYDVSGAGDTVIAVLALCLAGGIDVKSALEIANAAAGIVVGKVGTAPVEQLELLASLNPPITPDAQRKILSLARAIDQVAIWKARGEQIVLTNGCFDLLHIGHISLLEEARKFGDRLLVAINSDSSVRALKGHSRPLVNQEQRAHILASLAVIDAVTIFSDATPLETILALQPDVLVKGGDYDLQSIVGAREVESWGGTVRIVPLAGQMSTTKLISCTPNLIRDRLFKVIALESSVQSAL